VAVIRWFQHKAAEQRRKQERLPKVADQQQIAKFSLYAIS